MDLRDIERAVIWAVGAFVLALIHPISLLAGLVITMITAVLGVTGIPGFGFRWPEVCELRKGVAWAVVADVFLIVRPVSILAGFGITVIASAVGAIG